jgi:hypothetical protein
MNRYIFLLALAACVSHEDSLVTGTQSLKVELVTPADPGTPENRLPDGQRTVTINVTALDPDGNVDTTFANDVSVYVQYLGTLTPYLDQAPLQTIKMVAGKATNQTVMLPAVFGPTELWLDDSRAQAPTYATGASPSLWFRDPYVKDIQTPRDEMGVDAYSVSPLQNKQVTIDSSRYGAMGKLIVTSVFAQGYTVSDTSCGASGPCTTGDYDHAMVFSFSAARDQKGDLIREGQTISGFAGGVQEFNGLTEIGFPQTFVREGAGEDFSMRMPLPAKVDVSWFSTNKINFERNEAAPIEIDGATVCALDGDYDTYKQWKIDPAGACTPGGRNVLNVITTGVLQLDPANCVGKVLPKVVGVLRPVNIGTSGIWIIYPRGPQDLTLPAGDAQCKL